SRSDPAGGGAHRRVEGGEVGKALGRQNRPPSPGKYSRVKDAPFDPPRVRPPPPPLLIGGMGPKVLQPLAARHADIWHFFVKGGDPEEIKRVVTDFDALCQKVGRDPAAVEKATSLRPEDVAGKSPGVGRARIRAMADGGA